MSNDFTTQLDEPESMLKIFIHQGDVMTCEIHAVLTNPGTSFWLKAAIEASLKRDPVDALNDAECLAALMKSNLTAVMERPR